MTGVTLAILAGGEGSRMGMPKGELRVGGEPILAYQLRQIAWDGPTMLVTAPGREGPPGHEAFDREVVDPFGGLGPLRGVLTALEQAATPLVVVATVDMPGVRAEQLRFLVAELHRRAGALGVMMRWGGGVEPFPCAFQTGATAVVARELQEGRRAVHSLCRHDGFAAVYAPRNWDARVWTNLNQPGDVRQFLREEE
jgi:molybdopterin-guanine dinucleotide biosynthesis protein A